MKEREEIFCPWPYVVFPALLRCEKGKPGKILRRDPVFSRKRRTGRKHRPEMICGSRS